MSQRRELLGLWEGSENSIEISCLTISVSISLLLDFYSDCLGDNRFIPLLFGYFSSSNQTRFAREIIATVTLASFESF